MLLGNKMCLGMLEAGKDRFGFEFKNSGDLSISFNAPCVYAKYMSGDSSGNSFDSAGHTFMYSLNLFVCS